MKDEERWSQAITWYFHLSLVMSLVILKKGVAVKAEPIWWVEKKEKWVCLSSFKLTKKENGWCCEGKAISVSNEICQSLFEIIARIIWMSISIMGVAVKAEPVVLKSEFQEYHSSSWLFTIVQEPVKITLFRLSLYLIPRYIGTYLVVLSFIHQNNCKTLVY